MGALYSQSWNDQLRALGSGRSDAHHGSSHIRLCLFNENDEHLAIGQVAFVALLCLAEQRGWRPTAFTRGDLNLFAAADASRCAVVLRSALEDGILPRVGAGEDVGAFPGRVERQQVEEFIEFCRNGGFWIERRFHEDGQRWM